MFGEWTQKTGLVLDDLWRLRKNPRTKRFDVEVTEAEMLRAQINRLEERLKKMEEEREESPAQQKILQVYVDIDVDSESLPEPSSSKLN